MQLATGKLLYSHDSAKLMTPASNTKLFSTALALLKLGPDYRLSTRLLLRGDDLILEGGGDPTMSSLAIPYVKDSQPLDSLEAIETFASKFVSRGILHINGDVVGDDSAYPWEPYPPGWAGDDALWQYGAPVSALTLNQGVIELSIHAGAAMGDAATLSITPAVEYFTIDNRIQTIEQGEQKIKVERGAGSRELRLSGTILLSSGVVKEELAVDDPALFTATALYDALVRRGVTIGGRPVARHRDLGEPSTPAAGEVIATRQSPQLVEVVRMVNKISQNLWAEMTLREVGRVRGTDGSRKAGLDELQSFLTEMGVAPESYDFEDGSGLSRLTLVSPEAIVKLLQFVAQTPQGAVWKSLMPVGAVDGSLAKRFGGNAAASAIHAKTGTLSHVSALSGYAESATYGEVAFSVIVNHTNGPTSEVLAAIDKIALALLE